MAFAARIDPRITAKRSQSEVSKSMGTRMLLAQATAEYVKWLKDHGRGRMHCRNIHAYLTTTAEGGHVQYLDDISYSVLNSLSIRYADHADHGRKAVSSVKTFLSRMRRIFRAHIDEHALTFGNDNELPPINEPKNVGAYSQAEIVTIFNALAADNKRHELPTTPAKGVYSPEARQKRRYTIDWRRRRSFIPLFFFLYRYAFRPFHASQILVQHWHSDQKLFILPPTKTNKTRPTKIRIDDLTARLLDECAAGKAPDNYLFTPSTSRGKNRLNPWFEPKVMNKIFIRVARSVGLPGTLYWLRRTGMTNLAKFHGGDLELVKKTSGHETTRVIERYLQITKDSENSIADRFNDLDASGELRRLLDEDNKGEQDDESDESGAACVMA